MSAEVGPDTAGGSLAHWTGRVLLVTAATAAAQILGFVFLVVLATRYPPADYGQFRYVLGIGLFAGNIASVGISSALSREIARVRAKGESPSDYASAALAVSGLLTLGTSVVLLLIFRDALFVVVVAGVVALTLYQGVLEGFLRFGQLATLLVVANASRLGLTLAALFLFPASGIEVPLLLYGATGVLVVLLLALLRPEGLAFRRASVDRSRVRRVFSFAGMLMVSSACVSGTQVVPLILLETHRGFDELAIFGVAFTLATPITLVAQGLTHVLYPKVAESDDPARRARMLRLALLYSTVLSSTAIPLYFFLGERAISLFIGSGYAASFAPMMVLALAAVLMNVRSVFGSVFDGSGRPGLSAAAAITALVCTSIAAVLLVPANGAIGAAWATLIGSGLAVVTSTVSWILVRPTSSSQVGIASQVREE